MAEEAPTSPRRRGFKRWKRWLAGLCLLPFVAFGLSNLGLGSPWGRHWLEGKIQSRCGLPTRVGSAAWSPWRGITLADLELSQPAALQTGGGEPLLRIDSLNLKPIWPALLFQRRVGVRSLTVERPRLVLTVEMLAYLAQQQAAAAGPAVAQIPAAQPPALALNQPPPAPVSPTPAEPQPQPQPQPAPPPAPAPPAGPPQPTGWLHLRFASFQLVAANAPGPLLRMDDLNGDLPLSGDAAKSSVRVGHFEARGQPLITDFSAQVSWQAPVLTLEPARTEVNGIALLMAGRIGLLPGLPLQFVVQAPEQALALPLPAAETTVAAQAAVLNAGIQGYLLAPGSWQGELIADARAITAKQRDVAADFQIAHCGALLRGGVLSCVDARLLSDDLSLLGNATLLADGRLAGVVRLVAAPDRTNGVVKRFFPDLAEPPALTPLTTEQRVAFDLSLFGTLHDPQLQLGQNGPILPLKPSTKH
jgi:hypothetical protein